MNVQLVRVHRVVYIIYFGLAAILLAVATKALFGHDIESATGFFGIALLLSPFGTAHFIAARGAARGRAYGRTMSRVLGIWMLFLVPVGTLIGIYIHTKVGNQWQGEKAPPL